MSIEEKIALIQTVSEFNMSWNDKNKNQFDHLKNHNDIAFLLSFRAMLS